MEPSIFVVLEHEPGKIRPISFELLSFAREIQKACELPIQAVAVGDDLADGADFMAKDLGVSLTVLQTPGANEYNGELYRHALAAFFSQNPAAFICLGHTAQGLDYGPGLAVRLKAANISGITGIESDSGRIDFIRPIYNGKRLAHVASQSDTSVLHLRPGAFQPQSKANAPNARATVISVSPPRPRSWHLETRRPAQGAGELSQAEVIVTAGNGVQEQETLNRIRELADIFPRSAVAGTRIVCDRGWLPYSRQIGATGATVSPRLYIGCGVSGAIQHLAGMMGSETIVAINTDPQAALMNAADFRVNADLSEFIPELIEIWKNEKDNQNIKENSA